MSVRRLQESTGVHERRLDKNILSLGLKSKKLVADAIIAEVSVSFPVFQKVRMDECISMIAGFRRGSVVTVTVQ